MKPFLSWAGSKQSVMDAVMQVMPKGDRLIDVFCGSGAVFMAAGFKSNVAADINFDLINLFEQVKRSPEALIELTKNLFEKFPDEKGYYNVRNDFNAYHNLPMPLLKAAQFIYLNKMGFNGLFRRNKGGAFNVPYGKRKNVYLPETEIRALSEIMSVTDLHCQTYAKTIAMAGSGDVVVCDPPYEPLENTQGFTSYSGGSWDFSDQEMLTSSLLLAHASGASVVIMNSGAKKIRELYLDSGFTVHDLPTRRNIGKNRFVANDVIAVKS